MSVKPIPDGYHSATPYLTVNGAASAIEFYKKAFGATERMRMPGPDGKVRHAEVQIGDSAVMLCDEFPEMDAKGPLTIRRMADTTSISRCRTPSDQAPLSPGIRCRACARGAGTARP